MIFGRMGVQIVNKGVIWLLAMLMFANDLVVMAQNVEDLRIMIKCFLFSEYESECSKE